MEKYRKIKIDDNDLFRKFNSKKIGYNNCLVTLSRSGLDEHSIIKIQERFENSLCNTLGYNVVTKTVEVPIIIECNKQSSDFIFNELITGEEFHRMTSTSTLLVGEESNMKVRLLETLKGYYTTNELAGILKELSIDEKSAYIYAMEQLSLISKEIKEEKEEKEKLDIAKELENESFIESFKLRYKKENY